MYFSHCQNAETLLSQNTNIRIKKLIIYSMQLHNKGSYIKDPGKNTDSGIWTLPQPVLDLVLQFPFLCRRLQYKVSA